jgi:mono/diheme cytochrome c family protein
VAYYKAVAWFDDEPIPASVREGRAIAQSAGCFGCHGPQGLLGAKNPRSFKGYIAPWRGPDFEALVHNDDELRQWILDGTIPRVVDNRMGRWFANRQAVRMPAYREVLADSSVDDVVSYIRWLSRPLQ